MQTSLYKIWTTKYLEYFDFCALQLMEHFWGLPATVCCLKSSKRCPHNCGYSSPLLWPHTRVWLHIMKGKGHDNWLKVVTMKSTPGPSQTQWHMWRHWISKIWNTNIYTIILAINPGPHKKGSGNPESDSRFTIWSSQSMCFFCSLRAGNQIRANETARQIKLMSSWNYKTALCETKTSI